MADSERRIGQSRELSYQKRETLKKARGAVYMFCDECFLVESGQCFIKTPRETIDGWDNLGKCDLAAISVANSEDLVTPGTLVSDGSFLPAGDSVTKKEHLLQISGLKIK